MSNFWKITFLPRVSGDSDTGAPGQTGEHTDPGAGETSSFTLGESGGLMKVWQTAWNAAQDATDPAERARHTAECSRITGEINRRENRRLAVRNAFASLPLWERAELVARHYLAQQSAAEDLLQAVECRKLSDDMGIARISEQLDAMLRTHRSDFGSDL